MSSSFDLYPSTAHVPTAGELERAIVALLVQDRHRTATVEALVGYDPDAPRPRCEWVSRQTGERRHEPERRLDVEDGQFMVTLAGTRADVPLHVYRPHNRANHLAVLERLSGFTEPGIGFDAASAREIDWTWDVSLELPQPRSGRFLAGYVVAALAGMTEALVDSFDGAGDRNLLPTDGAGLMRWYPEWLAAQYRTP